MTTLADLAPTLPRPYEVSHQEALVFPASLLPLLDAAQDDVTQHFAAPIVLIDGRYLLSGDLLSEVGPNGLYQQGFGNLDAQLFDQVEVIPWADAAVLIPEPDQML